MRVLLLLCLALPAFGVNVEERVIDGGNAIIGNYPYQLSLREDGIHTCGAVLIGTTRAVTGAQCTGSAIGIYSVLGGSADRTVTNCATCVVRDLNFLSRNPNFDDGGQGFSNDIAVIGFVAITLNENLDVINMATPEGGDFTGASCKISGWGRANFGGDLQTDLQQADVIVLSATECEATWGNLAIGNGHICTYTDGVTACFGDQGGPLECSDTLAGVLSWGEEECNPNYPYVSSRVSFFYAWINAQ